MGFVAWYYSEGLKNFFVIWRNYVEFFWYYFSGADLSRTLFSPWKRDVSRMETRGLHPVLFFQNLVINLITRIIGAVVRLSVILTALGAEIMVLVFGSFLLLVWILDGVVFLGGIAGLFWVPAASPLFFLFIALALAGLFIFILALMAYHQTEPDYYAQSLEQLARYHWFSRVWGRLGLAPDKEELKLLTNPETLPDELRKLDILPEEFNQLVAWELQEQLSGIRKQKFWRRENLMSKMPLGRHWAYAYTANLDRYAVDLSRADWSEYRNARLIGKDKDLEELALILVRPRQNNVILVGEPGVGRDTLVHTLAWEIRQNKLSGELGRKRILELDLKAVLADFSDQSQKDRILEKLFSEAAYAGNIILFIKNIHELMEPEGGRDIAPILSEFLAAPTFQIIGTTTPEQFHARVEKQSNIMKYCDKILVEAASPEETLQVLLYKLKSVEGKQTVYTYQALREIVKLADRFIADAPYPEKALDLMEEVNIYWLQHFNSRFITAETVDKALSNKIKVPLGEMTESESQKLLELEDILHRRVIGQDLAIQQIAETMRRARVGMVREDKPLGSFLFLGPTGVGKTESAKALAAAYFGNEKRLIRLDMSEYQAPDAIDRLLGSSATGREGQLISKIKENPYALLLLDEIEKAYPDLLNLFLQVLDEGYLTDAFGKKISFKNLIIIATSNAGAELIKEAVAEGTPAEEIKKKLVDYVIAQNIFRPEFLNRFEGVIFFHPLSRENILVVAQLLLEKYARALKEKESITFNFNSELVAAVAEKAYDPVFGARAVDRFIQDKIGDAIVKKIIAGEIQKGASVAFAATELE